MPPLFDKVREVFHYIPNVAEIPEPIRPNNRKERRDKMFCRGYYKKLN